jgi:ubiquinone biosynthesis protein UbiJ
MQSVDEALILLKRQAVLEAAMRQRGGIRITEEQELHVVRRRLADFPAEIQAVIQAAKALRRPIGNLSATDVENWASTTRVS